MQFSISQLNSWPFLVLELSYFLISFPSLDQLYISYHLLFFVGSSEDRRDQRIHVKSSQSDELIAESNLA